MPSRRQTPTPRAATSRTALALLLLAAVAACGQRGPLYLPERTPMVIGEDTDENADGESRPPAAAPDGRADASEASATGQAEHEDDGAREPGP